jgi:large subunit ribosomal protein L6
MSLIGRKAILIPDEVNIDVKGKSVLVKGKKGSLQWDYPARYVRLNKEGNSLCVEKINKDKRAKAFHGLTRSIIANMVQGVHKGYEKVLTIVGIGYKVEIKGNDLVLHLGFSNEIVYHIPQGVDIETNKQGNIIYVRGIDKQVVGQVASKIRAFRPPEPYKGKGIRYKDEEVRKKAGKAGGKQVYAEGE